MKKLLCSFLCLALIISQNAFKANEADISQTESQIAPESQEEQDSYISSDDNIEDVEDIIVDQTSDTVNAELTDKDVTDVEEVEIYLENCHASGISNEIQWLITFEGILKVNGKGDWDRSSGDGKAPWDFFTPSIISAKFNLTDITDVSGMFAGCVNLENVDLSGLDTSKVTNMANMFNGCEKMVYLDTSSLDTSKVENMSGMFKGCSSLEALDLNSFDTTNVKDFSNMFDGCTNLKELKISKFNTAKATSLEQMFNNCESLTTLDLRSFDLSSLDKQQNMFTGCSKLETIHITSTFTPAGYINLDYLDDGSEEQLVTTLVYHGSEGEFFTYCKDNDTQSANVIYHLDGTDHCDLCGTQSKVIDFVTITDVDYPTPNSRPDGTAIASGHCSVVALTWFDMTNYRYLYFMNTFKSDSQIRLDVTIKAENGYRFADEDKFHGVIRFGDGVEVEMKEYKDMIEGNNCITLVFELSTGYQFINTFDLKNLAAPVDGKAPSTNIAARNDTFTVESSQWYSGEQPMEDTELFDIYTNSYSLVLDVKANKNLGYSIDNASEEEFKCLVNGKQLKASDISVEHEKDCDNATITIKFKAGLALNYENLNLWLGGKKTLKPKCEDYIFTNWQTDNPNVATVNEDGCVSAKKVGSCIITGTTEDGYTATCQVTVSFKDVSVKAYYTNAVAWAVEHSVATGTTYNTFSPNNFCTRAQIYTFLYKLAGRPEVNEEIENTYKDVKENAYYYEAAMWHLGKTPRDTSVPTQFDPTSILTRADMIYILWEEAGCPVVAYDNPFTDISETDTYYQAIMWALSKGITHGTSDTTFTPDRQCTRAETIQFIYSYATK